MAYLKAQARITESLLACLILTLSLIVANPYFLKSASISQPIDNSELAPKTLSFLLVKGLLKQVYYGNYSLIKDTLDSIIPPEIGYKIEVYDENGLLKWHYQRSNFNEEDAKSAWIVLNGCDGLNYTNIMIIILVIS